MLRNRKRWLLLIAMECEIRRQERIEKPRLRDAQNPFELPDREFINLYRVSKDVGMFICEKLTPVLEKKISSGISVHFQVLIVLRVFATGGHQRVTGQDFLSSVSQPTVSHCVRRVSDAICRNLQDAWIRFPSNYEEMIQMENSFDDIIPFPGVLGAIDCTHVGILGPHIDGDIYKNQDDFHSLNVQMICDGSMKIINVRAYPGSVHDQDIWNYSPVKTVMKESHNQSQKRFYLLGDTGYALEPWLLTPLPLAEVGSPEYHYSQTHCQAWSAVKKLFGVLKWRWNCLSNTLHYQPERAAKIVVACAVLHNMMLHQGALLPEVEQDVAGDAKNVMPIGNGEKLAFAKHIQKELIKKYFS